MLAALVGAAVTALGPGRVAAGDEPYRTRIRHHDGSGRATIVDIDPGVPGAKEFVRDDDRPPPKPGELSLPLATTTPTSTPAARPSPAR